MEHERGYTFYVLGMTHPWLYLHRNEISTPVYLTTLRGVTVSRHRDPHLKPLETSRHTMAPRGLRLRAWLGWVSPSDGRVLELALGIFTNKELMQRPPQKARHMFTVFCACQISYREKKSFWVKLILDSKFQRNPWNFRTLGLAMQLL